MSRSNGGGRVLLYIITCVLAKLAVFLNNLIVSAMHKLLYSDLALSPRALSEVDSKGAAAIRLGAFISAFAPVLYFVLEGAYLFSMNFQACAFTVICATLLAFGAGVGAAFLASFVHVKLRAMGDRSAYVTPEQRGALHANAQTLPKGGMPNATVEAAKDEDADKALRFHGNIHDAPADGKHALRCPVCGAIYYEDGACPNKGLH